MKLKYIILDQQEGQFREANSKEEACEAIKDLITELKFQGFDDPESVIEVYSVAEQIDFESSVKLINPKERK